MKNLGKLFAFLTVMFMMAACSSSKDVQYLQDIDEKELQQAAGSTGIVIEPGDLLQIYVVTKDADMEALFNNTPKQVSNTGNRDEGIGYRVDNEGNILFPVLGTLHVAGLTRTELENLIRQRILKEGLLKSFTVNVSFSNMKFSVLGDVASPGNYSIKGDKYTLLQGLADAGDLNITALRKIYVIREKGGVRKVYEVDLKSKSLFNSPAYYLQQEDIIYVLPNGKRVSERDNNNFRNIGMWSSLLSIGMSVTLLIVTLTK